MSKSVQYCGSLEKNRWLNHHSGLSLDDAHMLGRVTGSLLALSQVQVQTANTEQYTLTLSGTEEIQAKLVEIVSVM